MPGGRPIDSHRDMLARKIGISYAKARKFSVAELMRLADLQEPERNLLAPKPMKYGRAPRYNSMGVKKRTRPIREFTSRQMAEAVAIILERITGEECVITGSAMGEFRVIRHCTGEKMEVV